MNFIHETIQFNNNIPIKIFVHNVSYVQNHWHDALEVLFVLRGEIDIAIDNCHYHMRDEDILVINPNEMHTVRSDSQNLVLALQVPRELIDEFTTLNNVKLMCNSCNNSNTDFNTIRKLLSEMIWVYFKKSYGYEFKLQSLLFEGLNMLYVNFKAENVFQAMQETTKYMLRMSSIIDYIRLNYKDDITLEALSEKEHLSISYLSRFFKKHVGTSFKKYLTNIRLENAVKDLLYSDMQILQIALDHGFPNIKSFLSAFKETYNDQPSSYRKKIKEDYQALYKPKNNGRNYTEIQSNEMFTSLYKYLNLETENKTYPIMPSLVNAIEIDITATPTLLDHTWKTLTTIGKAKDVLRAEMQNHLITTQKEIGFKYIRFHGIFDDDMMVYNEDSSGNPIFNFSYIDSIFDFLYQIGLKPFVELGFMPSKLANKQHSPFYTPCIISMPKNMNNWTALVKNFILHCIDRYGFEEVKKWYFEFWNEPEIEGVFWNDSPEDYHYFYKSTYDAIKSISKEIKFGGPTILCSSYDFHVWINTYFEFCLSNSCMPDFFTFHCYPHIPVFKELFNFYHSDVNSFELSENVDYLKTMISNFKNITAPYHFNASTLFMTEWNSTSNHRDLSNDTLYKAAYITKNILENMDSISSFGYWTVSDIIEEFALPANSFHGGIGLITVNGLKKPGYYAYRFLSRLGNNKISSGPGYYVTSDSRGYQIILYNYCHFDSLYCKMDFSSISRTNRYNIFKDDVDKTIQLTLQGLKESSYEIVEQTVNREHGSAFDIWVHIGAPEYLNPEEVQYISNKSVPLYQKRIEIIKDSYVVQRCLTPHEIRLIEIRCI